MKIYKIAQEATDTETQEAKPQVAQAQGLGRLRDYAQIKTNFYDADFWVIRKGSMDTVGVPVKEYSPEYIGIKVTSPELLQPTFLYNALANMHDSGAFRNISKGTTNIVRIRPEDIANIQLQ